MENLPIFQCVGLRNINPQKPACIFLDDSGAETPVTLADIYTNTNRMAGLLAQNNIGKGDRFVLLMRNHPEFLYALFAAVSTGAVAVPVDPRSKGKKLAFQINNTQSKGILVSGDFLPSLDEVAADIRGARVLGVLADPGQDTGAYPLLGDALASMSPETPASQVPLDLAAPAQIIHTSGTTGDPKGVVLKADRFMISGMLGSVVFQYQPDDILYTGLSLTHGNAQSVSVIPALALGLTAVVSRRFTKSKLWDICRKHGCTSFSLLGGMMSGIYNEPPRPNDAENPVRRVISAGTPRAIWESFEKRFNVRIHEWYGAVEGGLAHNPPGTGPVGSFGKAPAGLIEMKIVDENDQEAPPGTRGELVSRMAAGETRVDYFGKEKESRDKTRGGWLRSGDICHQDENGFFYFDFRKGGGLRRQGDFIQPDFVERVIGEEKSVSEVSVYGVPAASGAPGESDLVAAVAPFPGGAIDVAGIRAACAAALDRNSVPTWLQIVDEIPKTVSEKALDRVLREGFSPDATNVVRL
jgi:crotonobetaine/carnitine-CoA ligase